MTCTQAGSLGHLGQTTILPLRVHHCNLEEGQAGRTLGTFGRNSGRERFVSMQIKLLLGISISVCLCGLAHGSLAGYASGRTHLCQLVGKDKQQDEAGSRRGCVL